MILLKMLSKRWLVSVNQLFNVSLRNLLEKNLTGKVNYTENLKVLFGDKLWQNVGDFLPVQSWKRDKFKILRSGSQTTRRALEGVENIISILYC